VICKKCNTENLEGSNFCSKCGARLKSRFALKPAAFKEQFSAPESKLKKALVPIALVALLFVLLGIKEMQTAAPDAPYQNPRDQYGLTVTEASIAKFSAPICENLTEKIASFKDKNTFKTRTASLNKSSFTPRQAAKYINSNSWVSGASTAEAFAISIAAVTDPALKKLLTSLSDKVKSEDVQKLTSDWSYFFVDDALKSCKLGAKYDAHHQALLDYDSARDSVQTLASNIPWYPDGFSEISNFPGFAYKNTSSSGSCTFGSCALFKIVSKTDCPGSLYVETNLLVDGEVVDWSNDTARVQAYQIANMETTFTSDRRGNWEFVNISCY
jgi:hypothetical protein